MSMPDEMPRDVWDAAYDGMLIVGSDGRIIDANRRVTEMFGWPLLDLRGQPIEVLTPPALRAAHRGYRDDFLTNPKPRPMGSGLRLTGFHRDGGEFPVEIGLAPMTDGTSVIASVRDVSQWRKVVDPPNLRPLLWLLVTNAILSAMTLATILTR